MRPIAVLLMGSAGPPGPPPPPAVTLLGRTFTTAAGNKSVAVTPASGVLIVVIAGVTGNTSITVADDQGGTYTQVSTALKASSADRLSIFCRDALTSSGATHNITATFGTNTGGGLAALQVTNMTAAGASAVRGQGAQSNTAAGTNASVSLSAGVPISRNPIIGGWMNGATVGIVQRSTYTEHFDENFSNPSTQWEAMSKNSGETSATIAWGGAPGTGIHCACAIELNAPAGPLAVSIVDDSVGDYTMEPTTAYATWSLFNTGNIQVDSSTNGPQSRGAWLTSGNASDAEVMATLNSGDSPGNIGTWLNLGTTRQWQLTATGPGISKSCQLTVQIRNASTLVVLDTATILLDAFQDTNA